MKHFLLEGEHLMPFAAVSARLVDEHHAFLQRGYDEGHFLFSGPQIPAHGGFLVARAPSRQALDELLAGEPFVREGMMRFSRVTEFDPVQHQDALANWFGGKRG
ncbi:MAG: YciI family protein [Nevskia sp.]|nr:YciI family protein [Nevskia sp.]